MTGNTISTFILGLIFMMHFKGRNMCNKSICFTWNLVDKHLQLICQIKHLHLSVFIDGPHGMVHADCFPPFGNSCDAYYKNATMKFNVRTKEVRYTSKGTMSKQLIGRWTCRHGTNGERAVVFVSNNNGNGTHVNDLQVTTMETTEMIVIDTEKSKVLHDVARKGKKKSSEIITFKKSKYCSTPSIFIPETGTDNANAKIKQNTSQHNINQKTESGGMSTSILYSILAGGLVLCVSFVGVSIWLSRKCKAVNLKTQDAVIKPNNSISIAIIETNAPEIESNVSVYETIDENEMVQILGGLDMLNRNETEPASVNSCSQTSDSSTASDRSYLEVVDYDFYLNPYEALQCNRDSYSVHLYSTTVDQFECKLESSYTEASTCPSYNIHQSISFLPSSANGSAANDAGIKSDMEKSGHQNIPVTVLEMECLVVPDILKTTNANSLTILSSNPDNSNRSVGLPINTDQGNAMSTLL